MISMLTLCAAPVSHRTFQSSPSQITTVVVKIPTWALRTVMVTTVAGMLVMNQTAAIMTTAISTQPHCVAHVEEAPLEVVPVDQHQQAALTEPRPIAMGTAAHGTMAMRVSVDHTTTPTS